MAYVYTPNQVESVLKYIGVQVSSETYSAFLCYCPFHGNRNTPSFAVNNTNGLFICFNEACAVDGTLTDLVRKVTGKNEFEALRLITKMGGETEGQTLEMLKRIQAGPEKFEEWNPDVLRKLQEDMWKYPDGQLYMKERNFKKHTLEEFGVGYSRKQNMIAVPVHSPDGICVGIVGRSIQDKMFKNSKKLPRNRTLFNLHRAKKVGDVVIVVESSFDAMRVHQAGFPNVVAVLGGNMSPENYALLDRYFNRVIIMTDYDDTEKHTYKNCKKCPNPDRCRGHNPGRELGVSIRTALPDKIIQWAVYDHEEIYPRGQKDACDLTDEEIKQCINNAVSHIEYTMHKKCGIM